MPKTVENSNINRLIKAGISGITALILLLLIFAYIFLNFNIDKSIYSIALISAAVISGATAGFISTRKKREKGLLNGIISSAFPAIILFIAMTVAYKGFNVFELVPLLCCIFGGITGGIAAANIKTKKKKNKARRR